MRAEWDNLSFLYTETEAAVNIPGWFTHAKQSVTVKSEHLNKLICSVALEKQGSNWSLIWNDLLDWPTSTAWAASLPPPVRRIRLIR